MLGSFPTRLLLTSARARRCKFDMTRHNELNAVKSTYFKSGVFSRPIVSSARGEGVSDTIMRVLAFLCVQDSLMIPSNREATGTNLCLRSIESTAGCVHQLMSLAQWAFSRYALSDGSFQDPKREITAYAVAYVYDVGMDPRLLRVIRSGNQDRSKCSKSSIHKYRMHVPAHSHSTLHPRHLKVATSP